MSSNEATRQPTALVMPTGADAVNLFWINPSPSGPIAVTEGITTFTETYVELLNDNAISYDMFEELDSGVDFGNRPPPGNPYRDLPRRRTR